MSKLQSFILASAAVAVLTVVPAVIQGNIVQRWGTRVESVAAAERLSNCPRKFATWVMAGKDSELSEAVIRELGVLNYVKRDYVNTSSSESVSVIVLAGLPGPIARHPPEICYNARTFATRETVEVEVQAAGENEFRVLTLQSSSVLNSEFTVTYGFSVNGNWEVPTYPRVHFGGEPILFKMQIVSTATGDGSGMPTTVRDFLTDFVPALKDASVFLAKVD